MSEPTIIVIPGEYYGGAIPKAVRLPSSPLQSGMTPARAPVKKFSPKILFITAVSVLFIAVVGFAAWYFTKPLRIAVTVPEPQTLPVEQTLPPEAPIVPPIPEPSSPAPSEATSEPEIPSAPTPEAFSDTDNDKLTRAEETLYHTETTVPDTDADGFLDGHEVVNLYNPSGIAPEKLEAAGLVARAINTTYGYAVLYPKTWPAPIDNADLGMSFGTEDDEIVVSAFLNPENVSLTDWAVQNFGGTFSAWTGNKAGLTGLYGDIGSGSGLHAAFAGRGVIYIFHYTPANSEHPVYKTTFEMMLNSFKLTE